MMIKITKDKEKYYRLFDDFKYFHTFLAYTINDHKPDIYVNHLDEPSCAVIYSFPAYLIYGDPSSEIIDDVLNLFGENSWIVTNSKKWYPLIEKHFKDEAIPHKRVMFDASKLVKEKVLKYRRELEDDMRIEMITSEHLKSGIIKHDVIDRFFTISEFTKTGFGFVLLDNKNIAQGFCLTNYPAFGQDVELYFRVGFDPSNIYREKGWGTTLCTYFIEYCMEHGYNPVWDAANDISSHIALKLGYVVSDEWIMYNKKKAENNDL